VTLKLTPRTYFREQRKGNKNEKAIRNGRMEGKEIKG
jgi:hypothetical protein